MNRLREERLLRGWKTKARLAHELERLAERRRVPVAARQSLLRMIAMWENGQRSPGIPYRDLLCELYQSTPDALGIPSMGNGDGSAVGLAYTPSIEIAAQVLAEVVRQDDRGMGSILSARYDAESLNAAALDWMLGLSEQGRRITKRRVVPADVSEIRAATATFDSLDRQFGGGHARRLAVRFLRDAVVPRLHSMCPDNVRADLFTASAVLVELIGWMAYDAAHHALAQRYFVQSLRLAEESGDRALAIYTLTSMSDQALFLKRPDQALRLAKLASANARRLAPSTVLTEALMLEARAYAGLADQKAGARALGLAEDSFRSSATDLIPSWASQWDETVFASHAGTCWVQLGNVREAEAFLERAWEGSKGQARRRVYCATQLANLALVAGDLDRACSLARLAARSAAGLTSRRSIGHVAALARALEPYKGAASVSEFEEMARPLLATGTAAA